MKAVIISTRAWRTCQRSPRREVAALLLASLLAAPALAQQPGIPTARYPSLPAQAGTVDRFVPAGWHLEAQARGDLDRDGIEDLALVLHEADPANVIRHDDVGENPLDTNPRLLAVLFGRKGGGYTLAAVNHTLIPRRVDPAMEDPFDSAGGITIAKGALQVVLGRFFSAGSWDMENFGFTFRWQGGGFRLIGYDATSILRNTGEVRSLSIDYLTGRAKQTRGTIDSDDEAVSWSKVTPAPLLRLDALGDGLAFDPGVGR